MKGDFNLHHTRWQPSWTRSPSQGAVSFVEWADKIKLTLLSPIDEATQTRGNVLDLAYVSDSLLTKSQCVIARHLDMSSDHATLLTTIDWSEHSVPLRRLKIDTLEPELFQRLLSTAIKEVAPLPSSLDSNSLDIFATALTDAIWLAYTGSARYSLGHNKGNPWWNSSCKTARQRYKRILRSPLTEAEFIDARKDYRKTLKKAK